MQIWNSSISFLIVFEKIVLGKNKSTNKYISIQFLTQRHGWDHLKIYKNKISKDILFAYCGLLNNFLIWAAEIEVGVFDGLGVVEGFEVELLFGWEVRAW